MNIVYLDFQKAFDKVPHQRLLLKLKAHGIDNDVINWIEKWFIHRRQRIIVDGKISNWKHVYSLQDDLDKLVKWSENGKCY